MSHPTEQTRDALVAFFDPDSDAPDSLAALLASAFPLQDWRKTQTLQLESWRLQPDGDGQTAVMLSLVLHEDDREPLRAELPCMRLPDVGPDGIVGGALGPRAAADGAAARLAAWVRTDLEQSQKSVMSGMSMYAGLSKTVAERASFRRTEGATEAALGPEHRQPSVVEGACTFPLRLVQADVPGIVLRTKVQTRRRTLYEHLSQRYDRLCTNVLPGLPAPLSHLGEDGCPAEGVSIEPGEAVFGCAIERETYQPRTWQRGEDRFCSSIWAAPGRGGVVARFLRFDRRDVRPYRDGVWLERTLQAGPGDRFVDSDGNVVPVVALDDSLPDDVDGLWPGPTGTHTLAWVGRAAERLRAIGRGPETVDGEPPDDPEAFGAARLPAWAVRSLLAVPLLAEEWLTSGAPFGHRPWARQIHQGADPLTSTDVATALSTALRGAGLALQTGPDGIGLQRSLPPEDAHDAGAAEPVIADGFGTTIPAVVYRRPTGLEDPACFGPDASTEQLHRVGKLTLTFPVPHPWLPDEEVQQLTVLSPALAPRGSAVREAYRQIVNANGRAARFAGLDAPPLLLEREKEVLSKHVAALFDGLAIRLAELAEAMRSPAVLYSGRGSAVPTTSVVPGSCVLPDWLLRRVIDPLGERPVLLCADSPHPLQGWTVQRWEHAGIGVHPEDFAALGRPEELSVFAPVRAEACDVLARLDVAPGADPTGWLSRWLASPKHEDLVTALLDGSVEGPDQGLGGFLFGLSATTT